MHGVEFLLVLINELKHKLNKRCNPIIQYILNHSTLFWLFVHLIVFFLDLKHKSILFIAQIIKTSLTTSIHSTIFESIRYEISLFVSLIPILRNFANLIERLQSEEDLYARLQSI
ncbi:protein of unknown function [Vibrio tapetis subsp. tapetis]|uniref:Uncharacterized protein n=1 Tax=Vibrio tapetis subsp. tapetis TaxID=1671868 RepID=A0A2N8ZNF8_9VIBR|nr:protein of unknown function [Vibrio tapetis subsp. tapetis]